MTGLLGALQLSDSALPIGRFVHSQGVESWLDTHPDAGDDEIVELAGTMVHNASRVDGVFLAHAHAAERVATLTDLDARLTARKTVPSARAMSTACGGSLAALGIRLTDSALVADYAGLVAQERTDGNLAVVGGAVARALLLDRADAVAVELRGAAAAVLSAAVRLGRMPPTRAQIRLTGLHPMIAEAAGWAAGAGLDQAFAGMPALEIAALSHHRMPIRFFST